MAEQLTLGQFIEQLERATQSAQIVIDTYLCDPTTFNSYRGYYDEVALGFVQDGERVTVAHLLARAKEALDSTFEGYKGGEYTAFPWRKMWIANYSHLGRRIVGIENDDILVVIKTEAGDD